MNEIDRGLYGIACAKRLLDEIANGIRKMDRGDEVVFAFDENEMIYALTALQATICMIDRKRDEEDEA